MSRFRALICGAVIAAYSTVVVAGDVSLPALFNRAKGGFGSGDFKQSLADFDLLDATSQKPGFESDRAKLAPVILFYRGANLAALGRKDEAKDAFISVYRQDRMPKDVPFHEVRFDFLSKQGYGAGVLQKEPQAMQTLGRAVDAALRDKKLTR